MPWLTAAAASTRPSDSRGSPDVSGGGVTWKGESFAEPTVGGSPTVGGPRSKTPSAHAEHECPHLRGWGGDVAPKLAELTDDVLFEDVWNRQELAARDRSLITVAALVAGGDADQLRFHLGHARNNGVSETELIESITHLALYAGWPKAMTAFAVAKQTFAS